MKPNGLRGWGWTLFVLGWVAALAIGVVALWAYKLTPGAAAAPPSAWPAESALRAEPDGPTLLVFVHPRCPCSLATLSELEGVMAQAPSSVRPRIVLYVPEDGSADGSLGPVPSAVSRLPRAEIWPDRGGAEARRFGASTSGHVVVFGADGSERFAGGITPARGHVGDGPGRDALVAALSSGGARPTLPVFGCSLEEP